MYTVKFSNTQIAATVVVALTALRDAAFEKFKASIDRYAVTKDSLELDIQRHFNEQIHNCDLALQQVYSNDSPDGYTVEEWREDNAREMHEESIQDRSNDDNCSN